MCQPTSSASNGNNCNVAGAKALSQVFSGLPLHLIDVRELRNHLESPHEVSNARMLALGITPSSSFHRDQSTLPPVEGGLAAPLIHVLAQAVEESMHFLDSMKAALPLHQPCQATEEEKKELTLFRNISPLYQIANSHELQILRQVMLLHLQLSKLDSTLAEEMVKGCGSHRVLSQLVRMDVYSILSNHSESLDQKSVYRDEASHKEVYEQAEDALVEMQDLACELAHSNPSTPYPTKISPYTHQELCARLPLAFDICSPNGIRESFMVGQVTDRQSAQDDVGFVMWPSAVVLSSWLLDHSSLLVGQRSLNNAEGKESSVHSFKRILEIGSGCGLTGMVAARIVENLQHARRTTNEQVDGALAAPVNSQVILSDFNHKVLINIEKNIHLNGLGKVAKAFQLDFYLQNGNNHDGGWIGTHLDELLDASCEESAMENDQNRLAAETQQRGVDLILAADTICKPSDAVAVANTIYDALIPGGEAIVVSANAAHRFGVDIFEDECKRVGLDVTTSNIADMCDGKLLPKDQNSEDPCGIRQTSGFVDGMTLTMFRVKKP